MKTSKLMLLVLVAVTLTVAGCAGHHGHGMGHDMGMHSGEAAVARGVVETNAMVDQTVKDPEKAKQAKAILQDIVAEVKGSAQTSRAFHEQMAVMNIDYDAKPEQFTKVLDEMNNAGFKLGRDIALITEWTRQDDGPSNPDVRALSAVNIPTGMGGIFLYAATSGGLFRGPDCF